MSEYNNRHLYRPRIQNTTLATVDKLELTTTEFTIDDTSNIVIQPPPSPLSGGDTEPIPLFRTSSGRLCYGKAYLNTDRYNVSIQRFNGATMLKVSFNTNKLYHHYMPIPSSYEMRAQISSVRHDLERNGIKLPFEQMNITRLDLMKQRNLSQSLALHHSILSSMNAKRQFMRTYDDTFVIGNKSHQTVFYDKGIEAKIPNEVNLIRCEVRALKRKTSCKYFGVRTLSDVMKLDLENFTEMYNIHLRSRVFTEKRSELSQIVNELELIKNLSIEYRYGIQKYVQLKGVESIVNIFGGIDNFVSSIYQNGLTTRENSYKLKANLNEIHTTYNFKTNNTNSMMLDDIYAFAS